MERESKRAKRLREKRGKKTITAIYLDKKNGGGGREE